MIILLISSITVRDLKHCHGANWETRTVCENIQTENGSQIHGTKAALNNAYICVSCYIVLVRVEMSS